MYAWINGKIDGWIDRWIDKRTDGLTDRHGVTCFEHLCPRNLRLEMQSLPAGNEYGAWMQFVKNPLSIAGFRAKPHS